MIDHAGIIHMNGRIYDSKLGRFLQADPNVQAPDNSQNLNRYSYVLNNPLSYTDPSGYFFKAIGKFVGKYWRQIAAVVIGITTAGMANQLGFWAGLAVSIAGGALAGYVSTGSLNGALIGAFSAAAFYGVGQYFKGLESTGGTSGFGKAIADNLRLSKTIAHGMTGGVISKLQGGRFAHGFVSAGVTKAFSKTIAGINVGNDYGNMALQSTAAAVVGGGVSEATGGKFGNGARTAGFGYLFNQLASSQQKPQPVSRGNNAVLTDDEIANIVFNETASLSGTGIDDARAAIANTVINGDERLGQSRPATAPSTINRALSISEQNDLQNINSLVANVRADRLNGLDPTSGAEFFNFRDLNQFTQSGLQGLKTNLNVNIGKYPSQTFGPFNNSAPSGALGPTDIFTVIYR